MARMFSCEFCGFPRTRFLQIISLTTNIIIVLKSSRFFWRFYFFSYHCTKNELSIKDLSSKCDQIRRKLPIWPDLLEKCLMKNFIFCAMYIVRSPLKLVCLRWIECHTSKVKAVFTPPVFHILPLSTVLLY